jgi:hypothetical protein
MRASTTRPSLVDATAPLKFDRVLASSVFAQTFGSLAPFRVIGASASPKIAYAVWINFPANSNHAALDVCCVKVNFPGRGSVGVSRSAGLRHLMLQRIFLTDFCFLL